MVRYARTGQIHRDRWRGRDPHGSGDVERLRAKMAGPTTGGYSDRARTFFIPFSHRYVHRPEHCAQPDFLALLNFPALNSHKGDYGLRFTKVTASSSLRAACSLVPFV